MKKQLNYVDIIKETVVLTWAVAIIAAAVYFFLVPSHTSVSSISGLGIVLSNFVPIPLSAIIYGSECGAFDHRFYHLWKRVWNKNGLYKHYAACIYWSV